MTKKIFRSICSVAVCITLAVLAIILGVLYNYYSDIQRQRLDTQAEYVASAVEIDGKEYLFKEWKCGDYSFGGGRVYFYVFTRE